MSSNLANERLSKAKIEVSNLENSLDFYTKGLRMQIIESKNGGDSVLLGYKDSSSFNLELSKSSSSQFTLGEVILETIEYI